MAARRGALWIVGGATGASTAAGVYRYRRVLEQQAQLPTEPFDPFADNSNRQSKSPNSKRVLIIGGGVVGVATAYKLALAGHSVAVLEPRTAPGTECSRCAAGGMQLSNPVVDASTWKAVLSSWVPRPGGRREFQFFHISWASTLSDPFFLRWLYTFTKTSLFPSPSQEARQNEMLKFTKFAVDDMVRLFKRDYKLAKQVGHNPTGSLSVSYDPIDDKSRSDDKEIDPDKKRSKNPTASKWSLEPSQTLVGRDAIVEVEPSIRYQQDPAPTAATFFYEARAASAERFTQQLAERCSRQFNDVTFWYDCTVQAFATDESPSDKFRILNVHTNRGVIDASSTDTHVVVTAGAWTPQILSLLNLYAPVYPLTGYALSVSAAEALQQSAVSNNTDLPSRIVADKYMFTSRLGDEIRITSIGEFHGWATKPTPKVDQEFRRQAMRQFPQLRPLIDKATTYCGHRPYVNDGILLLGSVDRYKNLYVSCGPGSNGWKMAMGSGDVIARMVSGKSARQIQSDLGFDCSAFSPTGRVIYSPMFAKICRARWNA